MGALLLALTLSAGPWTALEPGLELGTFAAPPNPIGDARLQVLRVDPTRFDLALLNASAEGGAKQTAKAWCARPGCVAAINASMFKQDQLTSVGLMKTRTHVNNPANVGKYKAVLAFDPLVPGVPPVQIFDLEHDDLAQAQKQYGALAQNLRTVDARRQNRWGVDPKHRWSTAGIGIDSKGRVLLIHSRSPYPVHTLVEALLALPIDLQRALYVEGGPEATLYVKSGATEQELVGSYETGFNENDDNREAWPIPNVIAVMRKGAH